MPPLSTSIRSLLRHNPISPTPLRRLATSAPTAQQSYKPKAPPSNMPPSAQKADKPNTPAQDEQSSASTHTNTSSDEHPAKQPDPQTEVDRSTGFGNVKGGVPGGKEGLGYRSDRQGDGKEKGE
ncbi:hypothetical protein WHR41_06867 [Cladosporium halotolerans]|uniref:Uncharacterized protein n=1 Tax=Cladosporium halotolerans TaxID=1052096 RepID=A0AB34KKK8_9PEZI